MKKRLRFYSRSMDTRIRGAPDIEYVEAIVTLDSGDIVKQCLHHKTEYSEAEWEKMTK